MSTREGDWRDLLTAHSLAVHANKLWLAFIGTLATILIMALAALVYGYLRPGTYYGQLGALWEPGNIIRYFIEGRGEVSIVGSLLAGRGALATVVDYLLQIPGVGAFLVMLPLFNPFGGDLLHFLLSVVFYLALLRVWTYCGGGIARLTALEYGRDELPTRNEAMAMVQGHRNAFFFAPIIPLLVVIFLVLFNIIIGLIGSIPGIGSFLMIGLTGFAALISLVITFVLVLGLLSFGLMMPAVSISGRDAFQGFSDAYSYVLWGINRFVCYTLLAAVLGTATLVVASVLADLFINLTDKSLALGLLGENTAILAGLGTGRAVELADPSWCQLLAGSVMAVIAFVAHTLVFAYAASYFYTVNTIICLLLRKHVDRIEIDEIYEYKPEEEEADAAAAEQPEQKEEEEGAGESSEGSKEESEKGEDEDKEGE